MSADNCIRQLYHYAALSELAAILARGALTVDTEQRSRAPRVVWLADSADADTASASALAARSSARGMTDDHLVRFTVSIGNAQHWDQWAKHHHVRRRTRKAIDNASAGHSGRWWVSPRSIPASKWIYIHNADTGEMLWTSRR